MKPLKPINPRQAKGAGGSIETSEKKKKNDGRSKQGKEKATEIESDQAEDGPDRKPKNVISVALENALTHCREGMSDVQKSYILQKEAKILYETGNVMGSLDIISYAINLNHVVPFFLLRAMCYKSLQRWTDAYFEYCFCIQIEPEVGSHYSLRAQCLAKLKRLEMACEDLTHACHLDAHPNNYITRGNLYADMGKYDLAVNDLDKALKIIEKEEMSGEVKSLCLYRRAEVYHELGRYQEEIVDLNQVLQKDVNAILPRLLLARAYKMSGELGNAEEEANFAIILQGSDYAPYLERGDIRFRFHQNSKMIQALEDFTKGIKYLVERDIELTAIEIDRERGISRPAGAASSSSNADDFDEDGEDTATERRGNHSRHGKVLDRAVLNDTMADAYSKRAQCILMLDHQSEQDLRMALEDSTKAFQLAPGNEEHLLVIATCNMRLERLADAAAALNSAIALNPENERALFHQAFCHRLDGKYREAIDNLTKMIYSREKQFGNGCGEFGSFLEKGDDPYTIPLYRIFEMRGTLLHEGKSYKLASVDLGRAILLNPLLPEPYFLRADCNSKLGNFELAIEDLYEAEDLGFSDMFSLLICRGTCFRSLGKVQEAIEGFKKAVALLVPYNVESKSMSEKDPLLSSLKPPNSPMSLEIDTDQNNSFGIGLNSPSSTKPITPNIGGSSSIPANATVVVDDFTRIKSVSILALSFMDLHDYCEAFSYFKTSFKILQDVHDRANRTLLLSPNKKDDINALDMPLSLAKDRFLSKKIQRDVLSGRSTMSISERKKRLKQSTFEPSETSQDEIIVTSCRRLQWTTAYHMAACLHALRKYPNSSKLLRYNLKKRIEFAPDDFAIGVSLFFYGVQCNILGSLTEAEDSFLGCMSNIWFLSSNKNQALCKFAYGKTLQSTRRYSQAEAEFDVVITLQPQNAHAYFRRAWARKSQMNLDGAASDFEFAKSLHPTDPNFFVDYRKVRDVDFVEIDSEPDLIEQFPVLLPAAS